MPARAQALAQELFLGGRDGAGSVLDHGLPAEDLLRCAGSGWAGNGSDAKPREQAKGKQGTFMGVYLPVVTSMWGVLIFIRFGVVVGYAGWVVALGFCVLAACVQVLTTLSLCAVLSNSSNLRGGSFGILKRNLGGEIAGVVCLLYYLGMTTLASVELLGSVQAIGSILTSSKNYNGDSITGSQYLDQIAIGGPLLVILAGVRAVDVRFVHGITTFIFVVVIVSFLFGFVGLFLSGGSWRGTVGDLDGVTGLNLTTFINNARPDYAPPPYTDEELMEDFGVHRATVQENAVGSSSDALAIIFPMFLGIFQGANKAADLRTPSASIVKGTSLAILTSLLVYSSLILFLAAVATRDVLKVEFLLFANFAWPSEYITLVGTVLVGVGACVELLEMGPTILQAVAEDGLYSFLQRLHLHKLSKNGQPVNAVLVSFGINFCLLFVTPQYFALLATVVTMFFLQAYGHMHFSLLLNEVQQHASWRPTFRYYHWSTALVGSATTVVLMFFTQWQQALITWTLAALLVLLARVVEEPRRKGLVTRSLQQGRALRFLLADDLITHRLGVERSNGAPEGSHEDHFWEPQVLCLLERPGAPDAHLRDDRHRKLLHLTDQLCDRGLLPQLAVVGALHRATESSYETRVETAHKVLSLCMGADLSAFNKVVTVPPNCSDADGYMLLMQAVGLGVLQPNLVLVSHRDSSLLHLVRYAAAAQKDVAVLRDVATLDFKKPSTVSAADLERGPTTTEAAKQEAAELDLEIEREAQAAHLQDNIEDLNSLFKSRRRRRTKAKLRARKGAIHVWWIVKQGGLPVLLAHLLRSHRVWRACSMRVFVVVEQGHMSELRTAQALVEVKRMLAAMRVVAGVALVQVDPLSGEVVRDTLVDGGGRLKEDAAAASSEQGSEAGGTEGPEQALFRADSAPGVLEPSDTKAQDPFHAGLLEDMPAPAGGYMEDIETEPMAVARPSHHWHADVRDIFPSLAEEANGALRMSAVEVYSRLLKKYSQTAELVVLPLPLPSANDTSNDDYRTLLDGVAGPAKRVLFVHSPFSEAEIQDRATM